MTATRQSMASFYVVSVSQPQLICRIQNTTIHFLAYLYYYPFNAGLSCLLVLFSLSKISLKRDLRNHFDSRRNTTSELGLLTFIIPFLLVSLILVSSGSSGKKNNPTKTKSKSSYIHERTYSEFIR